MPRVLLNLDVDDLERAVAFYTEGLALHVGRRFDAEFVELLGAEAPIYLLQKAAGTVSSVGAEQSRSYARHWTPLHLDFVVPDLEAAIAQAVGAGAVLEGSPSRHPYGRLALLHDPFGHGFCLIQFEGRGYDELLVTGIASVELELIPRERAATLANLFELYAHDFSEHVPLQLKPSGRFEQTPGENWWARADHFAYFINVADELAGFALVRRGSRAGGPPGAMDVAEFFVVRGMRRRGVGRAAAHALFQAFPGAWEIRVRHTNTAALRFWSGVVESYVDRCSGTPAARSSLRVDGTDWELLRFATHQP